MIKFLVEYIKNPRTVGAVFKSTKKLASRMVEDIDFDKCEVIAEFGAGTGVFTSEVIKRKNKNTLFFVFEINKKFCSILEERFARESNVFIINDSAENTKKYLKKHNKLNVDYIVSGLPFASLPKNISDSILDVANEILIDNGKFHTFQYSKFKFYIFREKFESLNVSKVMINMPPAYVLKCEKRKVYEMKKIS